MKVKVFSSKYPYELEDAINDFIKDKIVIGIETVQASEGVVGVFVLYEDEYIEKRDYY